MRPESPPSSRLAAEVWRALKLAKVYAACMYQYQPTGIGSDRREKEDIGHIASYRFDINEGEESVYSDNRWSRW